MEFDDSTKDYLFNIQSQVVSENIKGNFTDKDNFHLTLRFIGEVQEEKLDEYKEVLNQTGVNFRCFNITTSNIGIFPRGNKDILWVGIERNNRLREIYRTLEDNLEKIGIEKEQRTYKPHITLGRELVLRPDTLEKVYFHNEKILINKISLMHSTRVGGRLIYLPLATCYLK